MNTIDRRSVLRLSFLLLATIGTALGETNATTNIPAIRVVNGITTLDLWDINLTDDDLMRLNLTGVQSLHIGSRRKGVVQVTDAGLAHLKDLKGLQSLTLFNTPVTDAGMTHLKGLTGLRDLSLSCCKVTDAGLENLKDLVMLQTLNLDGTQVTGVGLKHLKGLTGLQNLNFHDSNLSDEGMEGLKDLKGIQTLYLGPQTGGKLTSAGLLQMKSLKNLRSLTNPWWSVTPMKDCRWLEGLKDLTELQMLALNRTPVKDADLENVKTFKKLQVLNLNYTQVTDTGLAHLKGLKELKNLSLAGALVTDSGVAALQKALPECEIKR